MVVDAPLHMEVALPTTGTGSGFTVIFTESDLLQPEAVMLSVNLYIVVTAGLTLGLLLDEVYPDGLLVQL